MDGTCAQGADSLEPPATVAESVCDLVHGYVKRFGKQPVLAVYDPALHFQTQEALHRYCPDPDRIQTVSMPFPQMCRTLFLSDCKYLPQTACRTFTEPWSLPVPPETPEDLAWKAQTPEERAAAWHTEPSGPAPQERDNPD